MKVIERLRSLVLGLTPSTKQAFFLAGDVALIPLALVLTTLLQIGTIRPASIRIQTEEFWILAGIMMSAGGLSCHLLGLPRIKLNAYEQTAILRTCAFAVITAIAGAVGMLLRGSTPIPVSALIVFALMLTMMSVSGRILLRTAVLYVYRKGRSRDRVLIYGAGQTGLQLATALRSDDRLQPVAFVDDNPSFHNMMVAGLPVYAPVRIDKLIRDRAINRVVLAMPSIGRPRQIRIARKLESLGIEVRTLPSFSSLLGAGTDLLEKIGTAPPHTYLSRPGVDADLNEIEGIYRDRVVMVTGAGGSIGSELCRQVLTCRPKRLVALEVSEYALYQLERELNELVAETGIELVPVLGSVLDDKLVRRTLKSNEVEIVAHAAAYKHVSMVERNALSGLRNNVFGTKIIADACIAAGVSHFILVSTDKAVRPTSMMGASKRLAEILVQDLADRTTSTLFSIVRFGNVMGSSGSVIPLFEEQIARGGPVTLSHTEVTRYFMTIAEASRLVLLAGSFAQGGGEVFVLDMGAPVAIRDLARRMIEGYGYTVCDKQNPDGDIEIVVTGLGRGEKLHEELVIGTDIRDTQHPKILRAVEDGLSELEVATCLRALERAIAEDDASTATDLVRRWVDGYQPPGAPQRRVANDPRPLRG